MKNTKLTLVALSIGLLTTPADAAKKVADAAQAKVTALQKKSKRKKKNKENQVPGEDTE